MFGRARRPGGLGGFGGLGKVLRQGRGRGGMRRRPGRGIGGVGLLIIIVLALFFGLEPSALLTGMGET